MRTRWKGAEVRRQVLTVVVGVLGMIVILAVLAGLLIIVERLRTPADAGSAPLLVCTEAPPLRHP